MGKKGDALRAAKAKATTYTFTRAQLEEHDRQVKEEYKKWILLETKKRAEEIDEQRKHEIDEYIAEEWKKREELFRGEDDVDDMMKVLSLLLATSSRVLIEKFGWKPIPKEGNYDKRNRTARFADCLVDEIGGICNSEMQDIRKYCDETYELYGVRFTWEEEHNEAD